MVDQAVENLAILAVLLLTAAGLGFWWSIRRLRMRKSRLSRELAATPAILEDRAFNAISMARSEADLLAREGYDVSRARERLLEAQQRADRRDPTQAVSIAQSVHESLVQIRKGGKTTAASAGPAPRPVPLPKNVSSRVGLPPSQVLSGFRPDNLTTSSSAAEELPTADTGTIAARIPKNRVESQFQIEILDEEIRKAPAAGLQVGDGEQLLAEARAAFGREEFTEALRLALRGRRHLGSKVEGLAPIPKPSPVRAGSAEPAVATVMPGENCSFCGKPLLADDRFCRSCGRPRGSGTCPRCGAPLQPDDVFCGQCGAGRT